MQVPDVSYAQSGDVSIAYQVMGEGPPDLVFLPFLANIYTLWQAPRFAEFGRRLATGRRLIVVNPRGPGTSCSSGTMRSFGISWAGFEEEELDTAGDGFFAAFDGPGRAIQCARAVVEAVRELGLDVKAGLHTRECPSGVGRGARVEHCQGSGRRLGDRVRR